MARCENSFLGADRFSSLARSSHIARRASTASMRARGTRTGDVAGRVPQRRGDDVRSDAPSGAPAAARSAYARPALASANRTSRAADAPTTGKGSAEGGAAASGRKPRDSSRARSATAVKAPVEATVASLLMREKETLAEEVIALRRRHVEMEAALVASRAETSRVAAELRKREADLAAFDDGGEDWRRATRVSELETEKETYLSEIARLASLLNERGGGVGGDDETPTSRARADPSSLKSLAFGPRFAHPDAPGFADGAEDALFAAHEEAATARADAEDAIRRAATREAEAAEATLRAESLAADLAEARETIAKMAKEVEHHERLASMEAAEAATAKEERRAAEAECERTRPALAALRAQLDEIQRSSEARRDQSGGKGESARERAATKAPFRPP